MSKTTGITNAFKTAHCRATPINERWVRVNDGGTCYYLNTASVKVSDLGLIESDYTAFCDRTKAVHFDKLPKSAQRDARRELGFDERDHGTWGW